jgi:hypothetical protein
VLQNNAVALLVNKKKSQHLALPRGYHRFPWCVATVLVYRPRGLVSLSARIVRWTDGPVDGRTVRGAKRSDGRHRLRLPQSPNVPYSYAQLAASQQAVNDYVSEKDGGATR